MANLGLIEGPLESRTGATCCQRPGALRPIAEALNAPVLAVVDAPRPGNWNLPTIPTWCDAVVLDGLQRTEDYEPARRLVELVGKRPVLAALRVPEWAEFPFRVPTVEELGQVARDFLRHADLRALVALAESRPLPHGPCRVHPGACTQFRIAYAQDDAFGDYFPDTLEGLESLGACLVEFSPLSDERLPAGCDLVLIGCGHPERFADLVEANHSMTASLREYVLGGGRLYAEGAGAAYLGRFLQIGPRIIQGAGLLPVDAYLHPGADAPEAVERVLVAPSWLGSPGTSLRGYRSPRWSFRPIPRPEGPSPTAGQLDGPGDLVYRNNAIGSLVHLHLASLPDSLACFAAHNRPLAPRDAAGLIEN
jgi:cobyrinic acid a,c-diamide synthase